MKKYITLLILALTVTLPAQAQYLLTQQEHDYLNTSIAKAKARTHKIEATLTVKIPITKQYFPTSDYDWIDFADSAEYRTLHSVPTYQSTVGCKAYALDDHWLLAGAACLWNGRHPIYKGKTMSTGLVTEDYSRPYLNIDGNQIPMENNLFVQPHFTTVPHLVLVRIPENSPVAATVKDMPKINILVFMYSNPLQWQKGTFFVNTSRFGLNSARLRNLQEYNFPKHTLTIRESFDQLSTLSNDPLLYVEQEKVYLLGINNGIMRAFPTDKWDALPSKEFVLFNNSDLDFIKQVITQEDPQAWPRVAKRLYKKR